MSVLLCNGLPADAAALAALAQVNYGHFTALAARNATVRGLDLHLRRLREGTQALFGTDLDEARVRADLRAALAAAGQGNAWLRVSVFSRAFDFRAPLAAVPVDLLVSAVALGPAPAAPMRVRPVVFRRHRAELKHVATFPLFDLRRQALADGWDDAVFSGDDGQLLEGTTWNLGLWDGRQVTWPSGPVLRGTCERLLRDGLAAIGTPQGDLPVRLADLDGFSAAFACNARGIWPLAAIGPRVFAESANDRLLQTMRRALETQPWQPV